MTDFKLGIVRLGRVAGKVSGAGLRPESGWGRGGAGPGEWAGDQADAGGEGPGRV